MNDYSSTNIGFEIETLLIFSIVVIISLIIDLFCHRKNQPISFISALSWSIFWITISLGFGGYLWYHFNSEVASLYFSGYILEKSLSVDNLFAMMAIFSWFKIARPLRHRILFLGILGAIVFRALFVGIGTWLLTLGCWVEIIFGCFVAYTAFLMFKQLGKDEDTIEDYSNHKAYKLTKSLFPSWPKLYKDNFFIKKEIVTDLLKLPENSSIKLKRNGAIYTTPLFLCLGVIELSDISFSFDSVPAVIAVSKEPLIIYSAMIFAVLGLRALYFVLESLTQYLCHLSKAVIVLLLFIAYKLMANAIGQIFNLPYLNISTTTSFFVIGFLLFVGFISSFIWPVNKNK